MGNIAGEQRINIIGKLKVMSLQGTFDTVSLAGVIQMLCDENKTGLLQVKKGKEEYQLIFHDGNIVYAVRPLKTNVLGELLLRDDVVSKSEIKECLMISKCKRQSLGKVLVEKGLIDKKTLAQYIYQQLEDTLFELFLWNEGEFKYINTEVDLDWLMVVNVSTVNLIMNAVRRIDEIPCDQEALSS